MRPSQNPTRANLSADLFNLLGEDAFLLLVEAFGGRRLYIPALTHYEGAEFEAIAEVVGRELALKLCAAYSPSYIRVPIARIFRMVKYHEAGLTHGQIATKLCMVEPSVNKVLGDYRLLAKMDRVDLVGSFVLGRARAARLARLAAKAA